MISRAGGAGEGARRRHTVLPDCTRPLAFSAALSSGTVYEPHADFCHPTREESGCASTDTS
eukprot:3588882-Prymnesium_polylepis.1